MPSSPVSSRRFTVSEYEQLGDAGILDPEERVELLDGLVVPMSPAGSYHAAMVDRISRAFHREDKHLIVRTQGPIQLSVMSQPEPDVSILRPRDDFYAESHPGPRDVLLAIEVSDTTFIKDRYVKSVLYAEAGIEEYWIVDLASDRIIVLRGPARSGYRDVSEFDVGIVLAPALLSNTRVRW